MGALILIAGSALSWYGGILATKREYSKSLYIIMGSIVLFFAYGLVGGNIYKWIFAGIIIAIQLLAVVRLKMTINKIQLRDAGLSE